MFYVTRGVEIYSLKPRYVVYENIFIKAVTLNNVLNYLQFIII